MPMATTESRIRATAAAMTPQERARRFAHLRCAVSEQGGILLDENMTLELVCLAHLLGIDVQVERVDLPSFGARR